MHKEIKELIKLYDLIPFPIEKTLFSQTYQSEVGTAIIGLFCNEPESKSLFHKLTEDEIWHFYSGDPLRLVLLYPDGSTKDVIMGNNPLKGELVQFTVPAGVWQAGHVFGKGKYALYGCTMAPGFKSEMFLGGTGELIRKYPHREEDIIEFGCHMKHTSMPD